MLKRKLFSVNFFLLILFIIKINGESNIDVIPRRIQQQQLSNDTAPPPLLLPQQPSSTIIQQQSSSSSGGDENEVDADESDFNTSDSSNLNYTNLIRISDLLNVFNIENVGLMWNNVGYQLNKNCSRNTFEYLKGLESGKHWAIQSKFIFNCILL